MNFPVTINIDPLSIQLHTVFEVLAFFLGFRYFVFLRKRQNDPVGKTNRLWVIVGATAGALIFSRLIGALENPSVFFSGSQGPLYYYQSKTIVGGLLGGLFGVEMIKKAIGEKESSGDLFVFPLILAMIIGRMGCFTMGVHEETYGTETNLPWGMDLGDGLFRHPLALYEIFFLSLLCLALVQMKKKANLRNGMLFKFFMIGYLTYRFTVDFIKPGVDIIGGISMIQLTCTAGLFYYAGTVKNLIFHFQKLSQANE